MQNIFLLRRIFNIYFTLTLFLRISNSIKTQANILYASELPCGTESPLPVALTETGLTSSIVLRASPDSSYKPGFNCSLLIQPPTGHGVIAILHRVELRKSATTCWDKLNMTYKPVVDDEEASGSSRNLSACSFGKNSFFIMSNSQANKGAITVVFNSSPRCCAVRGYGFDITFTAYQSGKSCGDDRYRCANSHCIWSGLRCNGKPECADHSDEGVSCPKTKEKSVAKSSHGQGPDLSHLAQIVGSLVAVMILGGLVVWLVVRKPTVPARSGTASAPSPQSLNSGMPSTIPAQMEMMTLPPEYSPPSTDRVLENERKKF